MTDKKTKQQEVMNRAAHAQALRDNPFFAEIFTALKAGYFDKLTKVKKGDGYEQELVSIHESMSNLTIIEAYIDRCIGEAKVIVNANNAPDVL